MTEFQLDQNINAKRLADRCNAEGNCTVLRFPKRLVDALDDVILPDLLGKSAPLISADWRIVEEHPNSIPPENPGMIIVKTNSKRTMTESIATRIIERFKRRFPAWRQTEWSRLYLEITEDEIYISRLVNGNISGGHELKFENPDFSIALLRAVEELRAALPQR